MSQAAVAAKGPFRRLAHFAGRTLKTSLAAVGVAAIGAAYYEYKMLSPAWDDDKTSSPTSSLDALSLTKMLDTTKKDKDGEATTTTTITSDSMLPPEPKKKKVLVIPFHRLKLVERKKSDLSASFAKRFSGDESDLMPIEMEVRELVDVIHKAASDPEIAALYGVFGHGSRLATSGWADLEEVRNALRVFRESHRRHAEPNLGHQELLIPRITSKPMYAYTDTFASFGNPGNKDYYLASAFTHVHMQQTGELNLFGLTSQQFFLRGFLEKYGINVHVFKHGKYKNAPNTLTEWGFNRAHRENVANILEQVNADVCDDIQATRSKALLTSWLRTKDGDIWSLIQNAGTFPATTAWKSGLVDYIPRRSPLFDLIEANLNKDKKETLKTTWKHQETDFDRFPASKMVALQDYAKKLSKKKMAQARMERWHELTDRSGMVGKDASSADKKKKDKVALLYVEGGIADTAASKVLKELRKIHKDKSTKCVVVRVTSPGGTIHACETISQELKALGIPVIFSLGNVSASGGYYIASGADRIFASKKTITGSIGVFGIRPDFTDFVARYGISCEHVSSGEYSASLSPFHPMTRKMKENFAQSIDRYYNQFKGVVADGRGLSVDDVQEIAQGRVWTGTQAKGNGLVDEIGGLYRALAYAKRTHLSADADIVVYPKKQSYFEKLTDAIEARSPEDVLCVLRQYAASAWNDETQDEKHAVLSDQLIRMMQDPKAYGKMEGGVLMAADENTAINLMLQNAGMDQPLLPDDFWR